MSGIVVLSFRTRARCSDSARGPSADDADAAGSHPSFFESETSRRLASGAHNCFRPRSDFVPGGKLGGIVRSPLIGIALATLEIRRTQTLQVSSERIAHQGGTVDLESPRHPIRRAEQILFDHDSYRAHMWNVLHTRFPVKNGL
jgi:hypothetical protein